KLQDGDYVIFNRQPTLHKYGMMGHKVKVLDGKTFRLNPIVCGPYNADFDGDEMNMHCPQSEETYTEVRELMPADKLVISLRNGDPIITPVEDLITGSYIFTRKNTSFSKEEAMNVLYLIDITELPKSDVEGQRYSGKALFSLILPKNLNLEYKNKLCSIAQKANGSCPKCKKEKCPYDAYFKIEKGKIISGVIDSIMNDHKNLVETIFRHYESQVLTDFYYKMSKLAFYALDKKGLTIALDDYMASDKIKADIKSETKKLIAKSNEIIRKYEDKTLQLTSGKNLEETFEAEILKASHDMKDKIVEKAILDLKVKDLLSENKPIYNNTIMIGGYGGGRGRILNVVNMAGLWGQVSLRFGRPKTGYATRMLSSSLKNTNQIVDYGFVGSSFYDGMTPKEYFFHSMGARQGYIDIAVGTKVSGYLYRRLANALKDLIINDSLEVITSDKKIIQFRYGEDGLSPDKAYIGKNINFFLE
ncbi:MAG: DNA-directed RNA polymerase subunit A', partial [archaeon]